MLSYRGQLRHCFWGDYSAVVVFQGNAAQLGRQLPDLPGAQIEIRERFLILQLTSDQVEALDDWLEQKRTDAPCRLFDCKRRHKPVRHEIGATAHSIDFGPEFEFDLPYQDLVTPQLPFPG